MANLQAMERIAKLPRYETRLHNQRKEVLAILRKLKER
jgi:hypothetical protein